MVLAGVLHRVQDPEQLYSFFYVVNTDHVNTHLVTARCDGKTAA